MNIRTVNIVTVACIVMFTLYMTFINPLGIDSYNNWALLASSAVLGCNLARRTAIGPGTFSKNFVHSLATYLIYLVVAFVMLVVCRDVFVDNSEHAFLLYSGNMLISYVLCGLVIYVATADSELRKLLYSMLR